MNERQFMSNIRLSFLDNNIWSTTLVDGSDYSPRPCDNITLLDGRLLAIEGKFQKSFKAFGMGQIRDSQVLNLDAITQGGGVASIFLNIWIPREENRLIIWEWSDFKEKTRNGSIKKKELLEMPYIEGRKQRFPVDQILDRIKNFEKFSLLSPLF